MEAPKCKLCGERHFGLCLDARANVSERRGRTSADAIQRAMERIENALPAPLPPSHTFNRKAYQRDYMKVYMRKRRAKETP